MDTSGQRRGENVIRRSAQFGTDAQGPEPGHVSDVSSCLGTWFAPYPPQLEMSCTFSTCTRPDPRWMQQHLPPPLPGTSAQARARGHTCCSCPEHPRSRVTLCCQGAWGCTCCLCLHCFPHWCSMASPKNSLQSPPSGRSSLAQAGVSGPLDLATATSQLCPLGAHSTSLDTLQFWGLCRISLSLNSSTWPRTGVC